MEGLVTRSLASDGYYTYAGFNWKLHVSGLFSVKSKYDDIVNVKHSFRTNFIWKLRVLLKIKNFLCYICSGVVLTKDNLAKHKWNGSNKCCYGDEDETIQHLLLSCPFARLLWRTVHVAFNLPPLTSISNMFWNWLATLSAKLKAQIQWGCLLYVGQFVTVILTMCVTKQDLPISCKLFKRLPTG